MSYSNTSIFIINFYFQRDNISIEIYITEIHYSFVIQDYLGNVNSQLFTKIMAIHRITSKVFHYLWLAIATLRKLKIVVSKYDICLQYTCNKVYYM